MVYIDIIHIMQYMIKYTEVKTIINYKCLHFENPNLTKKQELKKMLY